MPMLNGLKRRAAAAALGALGVARRNREHLYRNARGLRVLCFHATPDHEMDVFARTIDWCREEFHLVAPDAVESIVANGVSGDRDAMVVSFDDGIGSNYKAARWLADRAIRAIFFVVPSFVDRTMDQYLSYHAERGVTAFRFDRNPDSRGLGRTQIQEMVAMGHLIAGHNFAHRDLGQLTREEDFDYEIRQTIEQISEWIGQPSDDFAWGFGHSRHLSPQAAAYLAARCKRVYSGVRGLNVVGVTPRFMLRDCVALEHPFSFIKASLEGALDGHWKRREWAALERGGGRLSAPTRFTSSP